MYSIYCWEKTPKYNDATDTDFIPLLCTILPFSNNDVWSNS